MAVPDIRIQGLAWHDATCPEGPECRSRDAHSLSSVLVNSGVLTRYHDMLDHLADPEPRPCEDATKNPRAHGPHGTCPGLAAHPETMAGGGGARRRPKKVLSTVAFDPLEI